MATVNFNSFPEEILDHIVSQASLDSQIGLSSTCKRMHRICHPHIWRGHCQARGVLLQKRDDPKERFIEKAQAYIARVFPEQYSEKSLKEADELVVSRLATVGKLKRAVFSPEDRFMLPLLDKFVQQFQRGRSPKENHAPILWGVRLGATLDELLEVIVRYNLTGVEISVPGVKLTSDECLVDMAIYLGRYNLIEELLERKPELKMTLFNKFPVYLCNFSEQFTASLPDKVFAQDSFSSNIACEKGLITTPHILKRIYQVNGEFPRCVLARVKLDIDLVRMILEKNATLPAVVFESFFKCRATETMVNELSSLFQDTEPNRTWLWTLLMSCSDEDLSL